MYFAVIYGVWNLTSWGWLLGLIVHILSTAESALSLAGGDVGVYTIFVLVTSVLAVYFHYDEKAAFGR